MIDIFVQAMGLFVKAGVEALSRELGETLDFAAYERGLNELMNEISAAIVTIKVTVHPLSSLE